MKRLKSSSVAWLWLIAIVMFGILYPIMPTIWMQYLSYSLVLSFYMMAIIRWFKPALAALAGGRQGYQALIVSVFALLCIVELHRVWVFATNAMPWADNQDVTNFVVWMLAIAGAQIMAAPDFEDGNFSMRSKLSTGVALFISGLLTGIFLTFNVMNATPAITIPTRSDRPVCPRSKPVWVGSDRIYHDLDSPYRAMVIPTHCYATKEDAEAAGYRAPK